MQCAAILLFVLCVGSPVNSFAYDAYFGAKGGLNVANLAGDGVDAADSKNGLAGGAAFGMNFTQYFGARLEALYVMKGAKGSVVTPGETHAHESTWSIDYIDVPVVFVASMPILGSLCVSGFLGPTFGFNIESEIETTHAVEDLMGHTKSFEFGGTAGGGVEYRFPRLHIGADIRYSHGLSSLAEDIEAQSFDVKNSGLALRHGSASLTVRPCGTYFAGFIRMTG